MLRARSKKEQGQKKLFLQSLITVPIASSALIARRTLLLPVEAERIYCWKKKNQIDVNYFKSPALYYSKSDKTDENNAVCDGERM